MRPYRIALANLPFPASGEAAVAMATAAIGEAARRGARILCFPECFLPGYRAPERRVAAPDPGFLAAAWRTVAAAAGEAGVAVILGTERVVDGGLRATALVIDSTGTVAGLQDKVQLDPSEEGVYTPGSERHVFTANGLRFGIVICHEGWRYPETVRWAARRGAQVVFHPQFHEATPESYRPRSYAEPENSFHEKAVLCRAAENTCYFASVNYAGEGSPTTSAVADPEGRLVAWQPYGEAGLLLAELDLGASTGLLAARCRTGL